MQDFQLMETLVKDWEAHSFLLQMCTTAHVQMEKSIKRGCFMIKSPFIFKYYHQCSLLYKTYKALLSLNQDIIF